jgi:hypothetical protein
MVQTVHTDLYNWIDDKGTIHDGDEPPKKLSYKPLRAKSAVIKW